MDQQPQHMKENTPFMDEDVSQPLSDDEIKSTGKESIRAAPGAVEDLPLNKDDGDSQFQPPPANEARWYYNGLPSSPRLLGRTSSLTVPWPRPLSPLQPGLPTSARKSLSPIGVHRILGSWEDSVLAKMSRAISGVEWTTLDVVRIGYTDVPVLQRPVVVWVGVSATTSWSTRIREALEKSRVVLDEAGLPDVECEIRATDFKLLAIGMPELMSTISKHTLYPVSSNVGTSLCPAKLESHAGSLCIYLSPARSQTGSGPLWALTCRHVALPEGIYPTDKPYKRINTSQPAIKINSPAPSHLEAECQTTRDTAKHFIEVLQDNPVDEVAQILLKAESNILRSLKSFEPEVFRRAGSVYIAPEIKQAEYWGEGRETPYLWARDWCLIELDRSRFPNSAKDLSNYVSLLSPHHTRSDLNRMLNTNPNNKIKFKFPRSSQLHLSGLIPMEEIRKTESLNDEGQECFIVGKHGATTRQTWGCPTGIMSVQRTVLRTGQPIETREWAIIGSLGDAKKAFSEPGDSGSLVFGTDGRLGGILTRGTGSGVESDITYVAPMEVVLADIEKVLGFGVKAL